MNWLNHALIKTNLFSTKKKPWNELSCCFDVYKKPYRFWLIPICCSGIICGRLVHVMENFDLWPISFIHKSHLHLVWTTAYHLILESNFWLNILSFGGPYFVSYYWSIRDHLIFIDFTFKISILPFLTRMFRMRNIWFWLFLMLARIVHASSTSV